VHHSLGCEGTYRAELPYVALRTDFKCASVSRAPSAHHRLWPLTCCACPVRHAWHGRDGWPCLFPAGAQLQEQVAALKEEYSRLGDAMEKTQGSTMEARGNP